MFRFVAILACFVGFAVSAQPVGPTVVTPRLRIQGNAESETGWPYLQFVNKKVTELQRGVRCDSGPRSETADNEQAFLCYLNDGTPTISGGNPFLTVFGDSSLASADAETLDFYTIGNVLIESPQVAFSGGPDANTSVSITGDLTISGTCTGCSGGGSGPSITSGTFAVTYPNACTTTPTQNWAYVVVSDGTTALATVYPTDRVSCTSDATGFNTSGGTAMPAAVRPVQATTLPTSGIDTGASVAACLNIQTSGAIFIDKGSDCNSGTWTNSGSKAFPASTGSTFPSFTYRVAP